MLMMNHPEAKEIPQTTDGIYENLSSIASRFNLMGCSVIVGRCYFDGKIYQEDSEEFDSIVQEPLFGCMAQYPYSTIQFHEKNRWMLDAIRMLYYGVSNVIPHCYHNLPRIFRIKRSNGYIQDAIADSMLHGVRIRKSKTLRDQNERIYVRVEFMDSFPELTDAIVKEHFKYSSNVTYKRYSA